MVPLLTYSAPIVLPISTALPSARRSASFSSLGMRAMKLSRVSTEYPPAGNAVTACLLSSSVRCLDSPMLISSCALASGTSSSTATLLAANAISAIARAKNKPACFIFLSPSLRTAISVKLEYIFFLQGKAAFSLKNIGHGLKRAILRLGDGFIYWK